MKYTVTHFPAYLGQPASYTYGVFAFLDAGLRYIKGATEVRVQHGDKEWVF